MLVLCNISSTSITLACLGLLLAHLFEFVLVFAYMYNIFGKYLQKQRSVFANQLHSVAECFFIIRIMKKLFTIANQQTSKTLNIGFYSRVRVYWYTSIYIYMYVYIYWWVRRSLNSKQECYKMKATVKVLWIKLAIECNTLKQL